MARPRTYDEPLITVSFALTPTLIRLLDAELVEEQIKRPRLKRSQLYREIFEDLVGPRLAMRRGGRGEKKAGARARRSARRS